MAYGSWCQQIFANRQDCTDYASSNTRATIIAQAANEDQAVIPANTLQERSTIRIEAGGLISCTGTPTFIFEVFLGTTSGSSFITAGAGTGVVVGISAAITLQNGISNKWWRLQHDVTVTAAGIGSTGTTLSGSGWVESPGGFASPFKYALEPTTPDTATWTSSINKAATQYVNIIGTWSANSPSNKVTVKAGMLKAYILN